MIKNNGLTKQELRLAEMIIEENIKDKNGKWVTVPSNSPENIYSLNGETYMLTYGATKDIQLIRELFNACIKAGNFGFTAGVAEMLIQSHQENIISFLPALPKTWEKGEVKGLKARGNITVDMKWENNRLTVASFLDANDCTAQVKYNDKTHKISLTKEKIYQINIK